MLIKDPNHTYPKCPDCGEVMPLSYLDSFWAEFWCPSCRWSKRLEVSKSNEMMGRFLEKIPTPVRIKTCFCVGPENCKDSTCSLVQKHNSKEEPTRDC